MSATSAPNLPSTDRREVSPDQLDRLLTLIRPRLWMVLGALLVLVGLAVAFGFFAHVRQTVPARGVVQRGGGLSLVQAPAGGRIAVEAAVGDRVAAGDPLARIAGADGRRAVVRASIDGRVVDAVTAGAGGVAMGERLFALEPTRGQLTTSLAVPDDRRSELYVGAPVQVRPDSVGGSELGYIRGVVASIDPYPASDLELARVYGSQRIVDSVAGSSAVYLVRVSLRSNRSGGLDWSSQTGSGTSVATGQLTDASIIVSDQSVVDEVFP
jgi:multidrug efflux pump subunit AcrA (membrane-fusion protein)